VGEHRNGRSPDIHVGTGAHAATTGKGRKQRDHAADQTDRGRTPRVWLAALDGVRGVLRDPRGERLRVSGVPVQAAARLP
jgi:hypothetical protein